MEKYLETEEFEKKRLEQELEEAQEELALRKVNLQLQKVKDDLIRKSKFMGTLFKISEKVKEPMDVFDKLEEKGKKTEVATERDEQIGVTLEKNDLEESKQPLTNM